MEVPAPRRSHGPPDAGSGPLRAQGAGAADSTSALRAPPLIPRIYVANLGGDKVTAYNPNGKLAMTITAGIDGPFGVAVDKAGKIYVANTFPHTGGNVTTYTSDGKQTTPTITEGIEFPLDVLVDNGGKIYVAISTTKRHRLRHDIQARWNANDADDHRRDRRPSRPGGRRQRQNLRRERLQQYGDNVRTRWDAATPTITTGLDSPRGIAVDANGKITLPITLADLVTADT